MTHTDLKALRMRLGLTQAALAQAVGVVPNTLARWERGELAIPAWATGRLDAVSRSGSSGRAVTRGVVLDRHHKAILDALNADLDPTAFEACAADLLRRVWPGLVPVRGGNDHGFDGAVADTRGGDTPFPLISTTAKNLTGNLRRNLLRAQQSNPKLDRALFATSRAVKSRTRKTLQDQAGSLGVTLVQIADQDWFAQELYRKPAWSKRLLGVTGHPPALSHFPKSRRPLLGDRILGREQVVRWLLERSGDCLLVGSPGSGKTFLLQGLVQQGKALFRVGDDPTQIANDLRELMPTAVIIDDAHSNTEQVDRFIQLRHDVASDVRIIATSWPSHAPEVKSALQIGSSEVLDLDSPANLLDADTMIQVIKSTGLVGPDELLGYIRRQAPERPGLVATLAHLCLAGDVRRVVSGDELVDQLAPQLNRILGFDALRLLAPFALGGDAGVRPDRVACALGKSLLDVSCGLARLGAAGIVQESRTFIGEIVTDDNPGFRPPAPVAVVPAPFRWILVRRAFFNGAGSLPFDLFMTLVERTDDALDTLMGARARGASIPDLECRLEQVAVRLLGHRSTSLWSRYASLGPSEARYVVERHPDQLLSVGREALEQNPECLIPLLLDRVDARKNPPGTDALSDKPLDILTQWATGMSRQGQNLLYRRSSLLRAANRWRCHGGDPNVAIRAMCIAFAPMSAYATTDPGAGRTMTVHHDLLSVDQIAPLEKLWPTVLHVVRETDRAPWSDLTGLAFRWLTPWLPPHGHVRDEIRTAMRAFAERMLQDLADVSRGHPGVQHQLKSTGDRVGVSIDVTLDPEFEVLHQELDPREAAKVMAAGPSQSVMEAWEHRSGKEISRALARIESEADLAGIRYPRWSPYLCAALASRVVDPTAVAADFIDHGLPADVVGPFVLQAATANHAHWWALAERCLSTDDYRVLGVRVVVTHADPPPDLLTTALKSAGSFPQEIDLWCLREEVPSATLQKMLTSADARVAVAAAIGCWCGQSRATADDRQLPAGWREALLRAPSDDTRFSQHEEYWLGEILSKDSRLAKEWLLSKFGRQDEALESWELGQVAVKSLSVLNLRQRTDVLAALWPGYHAANLVTHLVADSLELYRDLLKIARLAPYHLSPLTGKPEGTAWRAKALLALSKGFTIEELVQAAIGGSHSWSGPESDMWAGWRRAFEALLDDPHHEIASIGRRGVEGTKSNEQRALERERYQAVHGI
ncbi:MAG: helix-turn-helix domain-containing protein [Bryobacterales bacterium]|nr:helix-turn-helix domain-containing protein [Bryobacterales bacterium]